MNNTIRTSPLRLAVFAALSLIISAALLLNEAIAYPDGGYGFLYEYSFRSLFSAKLLLYFAICFASCCLLHCSGVHTNLDFSPPRSGITTSLKKYFLCAFIPLALFSVLCLLQYWPCTGFIDTLYIIHGGVGIYRQHPFWYCALMNLLYRFASLFFENEAPRYALIAVFQLLITDACIAFSACELRRRTGRAAFILYTAFFCLMPIYSLNSIMLVKDVFFSAAVLLLVIWTLHVIEAHGDYYSSAGKTVFAFLLFFGVCAVRNNGKFILFPLLVILSAVYGNRKFIRRSALLFLAALALCAVPNLIMSRVRPTEELFQESVGIPLAQMSAIIASGEELDSEDEAALRSYFDFDRVRENYDPFSVDPVKWDESCLNRDALNSGKADFLRLWLRLFMNSKSLCIKQWLLSTYGYWAGNSFSDYTQSTMFRMVGDVSETLIPSVYDTLHEHYYSHSAFLSGGRCILLLLAMCIFVSAKAPELTLLSLPLLLNVFTLFIAAPIAMGYRYILPYAYVLPMLIMLIAGRIKPSADGGNYA